MANQSADSPAVSGFVLTKAELARRDERATVARQTPLGYNSNTLTKASSKWAASMIQPWRAFVNERHTGLSKSTHAITPETRARDLLQDSSAGNSQRIMWIDGVGGYLLLDQSELVVGQAISGTTADIKIVGDVSRQACVIRRSENDYLLQPLQSMKIGSTPIDRAQILKNGNVIQFGDRVQMKFEMPNPLSSTALLKMVSVNRFQPHVDGILLLADSCVIGPRPGSQVLCQNWNSELLIFRHGPDWYFRTIEEVEVNGNPMRGQIALEAGMRMNGEDFSLSIE